MQAIRGTRRCNFFKVLLYVIKMIEAFKEYIQRTINLKEGEWELIRSKVRPDVIPKRRYLLQEGQCWESYAFIVKGCVKTSKYINADTETIISFNCENSWVGDRESLITGNPSRFNIECLEETHVIIFDGEDFDFLANEIRAFSDFQKTISYATFINSNQKINAMFYYSADERYRNFILQYPQLSLRIPQNLIANFLGIKAETLSRLRKKNYKNQK